MGISILIAEFISCFIHLDEEDVRGFLRRCDHEPMIFRHSSSCYVGHLSGPLGQSCRGVIPSRFRGGTDKHQLQRKKKRTVEQVRKLMHIFDKNAQACRMDASCDINWRQSPAQKASLIGDVEYGGETLYGEHCHPF